MEKFSIRTLPPHHHHRPVRDDCVRTLRSVATEAAALARAMGAAGRRRRRRHAGDDVADLPPVHPGAPPFWEDADRMTGVMMLTFLGHPPRAVDGARGDRAAEGSVRARPGARLRAGAQRARAPGARRAPAPAAGAGRPALPLQHARERAGARRRGLAARIRRAAEPHRLPARGGAAARTSPPRRSAGSCSWSGPISS